MKRFYTDIHTHYPQYGVLSPRMAGIHPWQCENYVSLPDLSQCDIIGETGLDYACGADRAKQDLLFREHLTEAERLQKPVVLHVVKAFEEVARILPKYRLHGVVFHGFVGSIQQAERCFEHGWYLSFGARSLRSQRTREVIAKTPSSLLFCETDDAVTPSIEQIYCDVARLRNTQVEELQIATYENYKKLINIR